VAVESAMNSVIAIDLIKGVFTEWPRLENDAYIISTGSARPLEVAFRIAHLDLNWISAGYGFDRMDAYQLVAQIAESPVANVCDPNYTFVAKAAKRYLPRGEAYGGIRESLKELAAAYSAQRR